ncbi:MAG: DsbA family protein [Acidobacteria bacterium]|nr:DsbA family protein [Acidobacteriota bacterium]MCA1627698.1 DsbA family protein [Acidobacteriota bacterium]
MKRLLPFIIILIVLAVAVGSAWYATRTTPGSTTVVNQPSPASPNQPASTARPAPLVGLPGAEPAHTLGAANAPAHIEEFGDFQCPPCGMLHPILEKMHEEFGDKLRVTFREYPLPGHNHAVAAASAAEAAGMQKKFWEMHAHIYEHQADWKNRYDVAPIFEGYAKQIGLDVERWKRDLSSEQVAQRIFLDSRRGQSMGVKGTPTAFLNGREVPFETLMAPDKLRAVIQNEINASGSR